MAYTLSHQLRFGESGDLLWLACVGVTDAFTRGRLEMGGYTAFVADLRNHTDRSSGGISCRAEPRTLLLRHWNLLDAMLHSPYVCTTLKAWTEEGRFRLMELLAKMGLPLQQCRQPWAFVSPHLKRSLRKAMAEHAPDFGLDECFYTGFVRSTAFGSAISASDMAHAVGALLEHEPKEDATNFQRDDLVAFNVAYDALNAKPSSCSDLKLSSSSNDGEGTCLSTLVNGGDLSGSSGLGAGIRLAMRLQKVLISTAVGLVERRAIVTLKHFRYAHLVEEPLFARPLALCRLATFLTEMHRDKWAKADESNPHPRPLVLVARVPSRETCLVVGYEEVGGRNRFHQYFGLTAKSMEGLCEVQLESFEGNVVEVEAGGEQRFIEQLHYLMDALEKQQP